ncbi:MAG: arylsulfatase, partial [Planctomycetota bacterium]
MPEEPGRKPNVVLVITDDQGYGDLGCHGNPVISTPNLDELHGVSFRLANFHVGPTCAPTRAGLMTGRYCNCTGVWHTIAGRSLIRRDEVTMGDVFRAGGYRTGIFGKWHLGDNYPFRPHDRGFDEAVVHGGGGVSQTPDYWGNDYFDDTYFNKGAEQKFEGYCTDVWFDLAMRFIERNKDRPFFCYLSTNAPHGPYLVADSYSAPYRDKVPLDRANFFGMITCIDDNMARLRAKLKGLGLERDTILVFVTDNGSSGGSTLDRDQFVVEGYNAGMRGKKGSEYDGGHRTPLFLHWPGGGFDRGRDIDELTANIDVLPTLAELCGIKGPDPDRVQGRSLVPLLKGEPWPERTIVTDSQRIAHPEKWRKSATMTDRWRLVNGKELYDIREDPEQRTDVAADHPEVVEELRGHYEKWWELVSERFDEPIPVIVGSGEEELTDLTGHDWHNDECDCPWSQGHIRKGPVVNGYWDIDVAKAGEYSFELRRWPVEGDRGMTDGIPGRI